MVRRVLVETSRSARASAAAGHRSAAGSRDGVWTDLDTERATHRAALAVTHARDATSAPILERLGFETLYRYECLYRMP
jgi:hypothetical protein